MGTTPVLVSFASAARDLAKTNSRRDPPSSANCRHLDWRELLHTKFHFRYAGGDGEHGFDAEFPNDQNPAAFKAQLIERMRLLRDSTFWGTAEQNLKPKHLHASGYNECNADRAYANDLHICYCASAESLSHDR
jgi:hypothetical protein